MDDDPVEVILLRRRVASDPTDGQSRMISCCNRLSPEMNLVLAILLNAIEDLSVSVLYLRREAAEWISLDNDYVFGFVSICDELDISPSDLRKHLAPLVAAGLLQAERPERGAAIPHDDHASHRYVSSGHCSECHMRYRHWYKQHGPIKRRGSHQDTPNF